MSCTLIYCCHQKFHMALTFTASYSQDDISYQSESFLFPHSMFFLLPQTLRRNPRQNFSQDILRAKATLLVHSYRSGSKSKPVVCDSSSGIAGASYSWILIVYSDLNLCKLELKHHHLVLITCNVLSLLFCSITYQSAKNHCSISDLLGKLILFAQMKT